MAGRSQRHMQEQWQVYGSDSNGNAPPVLATDIASESTSTTVSVDVSGNFTGENAGQYSIENPPESCTINSAGVIAGTSSAGSYTDCRVFAKNGYGETHTRKFTWTVS